MPRKATEKAEKKATSKNSKVASVKESKETKKNISKASQKEKTGSKAKKETDNRSQKEIKTQIVIDNPTKDPEFLVKLFKLMVNPKNAKRKATKKEEPTSPILEYYDLPYRYNETVVKLLAQTPNILFVYWDISDWDRARFTQEYGNNFFDDTKPVLIVHNKTKNYSFEVEINDFANSWYLYVEDAKCEYMIELGRRPKNAYIHLPNDYLYVSSSNNLESPNDHILFETFNGMVTFQNIKTKETYTRLVNTILSHLTGKPYTIYDMYRSIYGKELVTFEDRLDLSNPSSGNPTSSFK